MKLFKRTLLLCLPLLVMLTAGCGSGASDTSGTLALTVSSPSDASQPGTATATYTPISGKDPLGVNISFLTDNPELVALETGSRSVGSDGTAVITFMITTPQQDTTVRITAKAGDLTTFQTFTITGDSTAAPVTTTTTNETPTQIQIKSITPTDGNLALAGTGTSVRSENGFVTFKVLDAASAAVSGQVVNFSISPSNNGGVALTSSSATTSTDGTVTVGISAGATQATVQITATLASNSALTATVQFSVTSGPPDQDSFSLAATTLNSETYNHDGVIIPITVRLADHFNNPPPPGTTVIFTTNAGKIDGSGTTDESGNVSVNWESQAPRTGNGRFVIMARTVGEESFTDANGNGLADVGEFTDTGDAYRDDNVNGSYDAGEPYYPIINGSVYSSGDALYNGMYQGTVYTGASKTKNIFNNIVMIMSTDAADITVTSANPIAGPGLITFTVRDTNGNTMTSGTTISVSANNGTLGSVTSFVVPQNVGYGQEYSVPISSDGTVSSGSVTITVTSPGGLKTILNILTSGI